MLNYISGRQKEKEWEFEEDHRSVNTTQPSITVQCSNVSEFCIARAFVDGLLRDFRPDTVRDMLRMEGVVIIVRGTANERNVDVSMLTDEYIIGCAQAFLPPQRQPPEDILVDGDHKFEVSSLDSTGRNNLMNQQIGSTATHSSSTDGNAEAAGLAGRRLLDSNPADMSGSGTVQNLEPIQDPTAAATTTGTTGGDNDDVAETSSDNGKGKDEENEDKKPNAKKRRVEQYKGMVYNQYYIVWGVSFYATTFCFQHTVLHSTGHLDRDSTRGK